MTIIHSFIQEPVIENIVQCAKKLKSLCNSRKSSKAIIINLQDKKETPTLLTLFSTFCNHIRFFPVITIDTRCFSAKQN